MAAPTQTKSANRESSGRRRSQQFTAVVLLAAAVSAISSLLYGYDTGIISGALLQIRRDFHTDSAVEQVIAGSILFGAALGALLGSRFSERLGRRRTILLVATVFVVGTLACALAPSAWTLCVARVVLGLAVGGATQTVPMYVAELAPARHRGKLVLTFQVGIGVGIVASTIVGATQSLSWRVEVGMAAVPAAILLLVMLRLPESPRWLVRVDDQDGAREALGRLRADGSDIDAEMSEIVELEEHERDAGAKGRGWRGLRQRWVRPALLVGCGIAVFTQLSGIEMIIYYAPTILTDNGFSASAALRVSVALGGTYLVMMVVGLNVVDRIGRRRLTLFMIPGAALALATLGALFVTGNSGRSDVPFLIACLVAFMFFNAGGLQLMGWLTGSEIYPLAVRSAGTSVQATILWSTNLLITLSVLTVINGIGVGQTMWLYAAFNVAAWVFVWRRMPDLTSYSLEQIEGHLRDDKFDPSDFSRDDH
ncbi:sugar porter family MFS transporter [uncultured Jatrophihabitans sp.]|uniref:sugar porter family MFS transporter n=1 Tax=uncultured Jatrophihabitans sp. TaxID=1610747 RepID=UPI0035C9B2D1